MPYIKPGTRKYWNKALSSLCQQIVEDTEHCADRKVPSGELNYIITNILLSTKPRGYEDYNKLLGVLEGVKLELYRRIVVPYEDQKIKENGDVF